MKIPGNVTHTYAELEVSTSTWDEIAKLLNEADYGHAFHDDGRVIDMHGIGLIKKQAEMPAKRIEFYVNGIKFIETEATKINYDTVVAISGLKGNPTVMYWYDVANNYVQGILYYQDTVAIDIVDGMQFSVVHTNNA